MSKVSNKKANMPKFNFEPDDEFETRPVTLSVTKWEMLEKYCGFVEKKRNYRPSCDKVFDTLLDDLFGTDRAFRLNEGLMRNKRTSVKTKSEREAQGKQGEPKLLAQAESAALEVASNGQIEVAQALQREQTSVSRTSTRIDVANNHSVRSSVPAAAPPPTARPERTQQPHAPAPTNTDVTRQSPLRPSLSSKDAAVPVRFRYSQDVTDAQHATHPAKTTTPVPQKPSEMPPPPGRETR